MGSKLCAVCGKRPARYVCQECGRNVCELCLEPQTWLCSECYKRIEREVPRIETERILPFRLSFMKIFIFSFLLIFIGMVILMIAALISGLTDSFSFLLLIGPIPIVFGTGQYTFWTVVLAIIITIISIVFFIILRKQKMGKISPLQKSQHL